jgi:hypothetical protein
LSIQKRQALKFNESKDAGKVRFHEEIVLNAKRCSFSKVKNKMVKITGGREGTMSYTGNIYKTEL